MTMDILAILMVAFCLFAILMFILFYIYARKYYNQKKISDDYTVLDKDEVTYDDSSQIELIDIMINGKNYVFDANNNHLNYNETVRININGSVYTGIVIKDNYKDDLGHFEQIPTKLILEKEEVINEDVNNNQVESDSSEEFVPKKKDEII